MPTITLARWGQELCLFYSQLSPTTRKYMASRCPIYIVEWKNGKREGKREGRKEVIEMLFIILESWKNLKSFEIFSSEAK